MKAQAISDKPREVWTPEETRFYDNNLPSELRKELRDLDKEKLDLYNQKSVRNKCIKEREAKIDDLDARNNSDLKLLREAKPGGGFRYFEVRMTTWKTTEFKIKNSCLASLRNQGTSAA